MEKKEKEDVGNKKERKKRRTNTQKEERKKESKTEGIKERKNTCLVNRSNRGKRNIKKMYSVKN